MADHQFSADEIDYYWYRQRMSMLELKKLNAAHPVRKLPTVTKILHASNEFGEGFAVFEGRRDAWRCLKASPFLSWIEKTPVSSLKIELLKRGMKWVWKTDFRTEAPQMNRGSVRPGDDISLNAEGSDKDGTHPTESVQATALSGPSGPCCSERGRNLSGAV